MMKLKPTLVMEIMLAVTPTNWKYRSVLSSVGPFMNWIRKGLSADLENVFITIKDDVVAENDESCNVL